MQDQKLTLQKNALNAQAMPSERATGTLFQLADGRIQSCDRGAEQLLGYSAKQLVGMTAVDLIGQAIHPDGSAFAPDDYPAIVAQRSGQPCLDVVMGFYKPNGDLIWLRLNSTPLFQPDYATPSAIVTTLSEAPTQQNEPQLETNLQALAILEQMTDAFVALDCEWRVVYATQEVARMSNLPVAEMVGKTHWEVWGWSVGTIVEQNYRRAMAEQQSVHFEIFYEPLLTWLEIHAYPSKAGLGIFFRDITEAKRIQDDRRQAEIVLQENEEKLRLFVQYAPAGVAMFDRSMSYIQVSQQWVEAYQLDSVETVLGRSHYDIFPEIPDRWREIHQRCLAGATEKADEDCFIRADGSVQWIRWEIRPWHDRTGQVGGIVIFSENITERKHLEITLRQNEQRYRSLTEATAQIVWNTQGDQGEFVTEQPGWSAFTGQSFNELKGWGWLNAVHPDDQAHTVQVWSVAVANRALYKVEHRLRRHDGIYRDMSVRAVPLVEEDGTTREWIGVYTDITDRKQAEAALQESETRFRSFAENSRDVIWITDPHEYRLIYVSPSYERVLGRPTDEVYTDLAHFLESVHPDDRIRVRAAWEQCTQGAFSYEYRVIRPDKSMVWIYDRGFPIYNQNELLYVGGIAEDITDRKVAEQEREQLLHRAQAARESAEQANRIKDEFLAVLSHELRSPLNPILGWAKLLRGGKLDPVRSGEALATIERNATLQSQLIEDLLDISRIMRGKLTLDPAPVSLSFVISAAIETVRLAAEARTIGIDVYLESNVGQVYGDAGRLQQVVWNLLSNAVKFTPTGGRVEVRLIQINDRAQLQVIDTGKGISPEFLPYVFEHFRQEDGATTRKFGGLGLGLAIARQIVELHGGTIAVASPGEGQGATFTVQLPLAPRSNELPLEQSPDATSDLSGFHILVVDDELDSQELVAFILEQAGAIVTSVSSGIEALQAIEQFVPDLVVSDIGMPEMDGYRLLQQIRLLESARQIPAIALTAYAGELDRQQAIVAGFQQHIPKPINPEELVKAIACLLHLR